MSDDEYFNEIMEENERLRAENEKLRALLKPFADEASDDRADGDYFIYGGIAIDDLRAARAALKETWDE